MATEAYLVAYPNSQIPSLKRVCEVKVDSRTSIDGLLSQLCLRYPDYTEDLKRAALWKAVNLKLKDVETQPMQEVCDWFRGKNEDAELSWGGRIVKSFPDGPHDRLDDMVDIVVVTSDVLESLGGDALGELGYTKARRELSKAIKRTPSPSDSVKSASAVEGTTTDPAGPRYGRPSHRFGPPTPLFSKPLALLKYNLEHLESYSPESPMLDHAFELIVQATDFFPDEDKREIALKRTLKGLLPGQSEWQRWTSGKTAKPGAVWLEGLFAYVVVELKNEPGLAGDPILQSLITYAKLTAQEEYAPYLGWTNAPAILLSMSGNRLTISIAVFTDAVYADELLSVKLLLGPHGSNNVNHIARVFMAINESKDQLAVLYRGLLDSHPTPSVPTPVTKALWPNPTPYPPDSTTQLPNLDFICKVDRADGTRLFVVDEDNERHALYLARMPTSNEDVLVKFSANYHEDAHRLLANAEPPLAPALHFCTRVIGDMYMVVMEYVPKAKGQSLFIAPPPQSALEDVREGIDRALDLLHEKDLVFGDLREPNVLYLPGDTGRVLLVDFDGVGQDGKDRYSACLNPETKLGVARGQIMKKADDRKNLERLMGRLKERIASRVSQTSV